MKWLKKQPLTKSLAILLLFSFANEFIPGGGVRLAYAYTSYHLKATSETTSSDEAPAFATTPACSPLPNGESPCTLQVHPRLAGESCVDDDCITLVITYYKKEYAWMKYLPFVKPMFGKIGLKGEWSMPAPRGDSKYLIGEVARAVDIKGCDLGISSSFASEQIILNQQIKQIRAEVRRRASKKIASLN